MTSRRGDPYDEMFYRALLIRRVEERIAELYPSDKIQSPVHLSVGQEAVAVGACRPLRRTDLLFGSYRGHAYYIAKGGSLRRLFAELYGKSTGCCGGKGGSMHLAAPEVGFMGTSALVASTIPHAVGAALASKTLGRGQVVMSTFGDGATDEGEYHESLNFASLRGLPVVFVCENNGLAVHSRSRRRQSYSIAEHAATYGIRVARVEEGYDFAKVSEAVSTMVGEVRAGGGPRFVEVTTYRYREHVGVGEDYDAGYRSRDELRAWMAKDPLVQDAERARRHLPAIRRLVDDAVSFAERSPWPAGKDLLSDVINREAGRAYRPPKGLYASGDGSTTMTYREALFRTMRSALSSHPNVIILGQGVDDHKGTFGTTLGLASEFGEGRVMDTPLAEEGMTGVAIGAALNGLRPIQTHIRTDFSLLAANQIINLAAKYRYMFGGRFDVPLLIRTVIGRSWGQGAQHSQSLQSLYAHIPGLTVIMPSDADSILESYPYIAARHRGPVVSLEHRLLYDLRFPVGGKRRSGSPLTSRMMRRGGDVTIVATSIMVLESMRAADHLSRAGGVECEVIDLNCVTSPDREMIVRSVKKTGRLLVADTSWQAYGVCAEVSRVVGEELSGLKSPVVTVGMRPAPCPTAKTLEDLYYPNLTTLADAAARLATGRSEHGIELPREQSMADTYKRFKGPF